jgi:hypothetical protein
MSEAPVSPEPTTKKQVFEHMFPGNSWDALRTLDFRNAKFFGKEFIASPVSDYQKEFGKAMEKGEGYVYRVDLPFPDKASVGWVLFDVQPLKENAAAVRGWISDLIKEGEKLGGIGIRPMSWIKNQYATMKEVLASSINNAQLNDEGTAMTVGIMNAEGKPSAVIIFRKGKRPRKGIRENKSVLVGKPVSSPIPIGI